MSAPRSSIAVGVVLALVAIGCGGAPHPYAVWSAPKPMTAELDCASLDAWVSKSGKEGIGLTVSLRRLDRDRGLACRVEVRSVAIVVGGLVHATTRLPPAPDLRGGATVFLYVPIPFDDNTAWNAGARDGKLVIEVETNGHPNARLEWSVTQAEQTVFACGDENGEHGQRIVPHDEKNP